MEDSRSKENNVELTTSQETMKPEDSGKTEKETKNVSSTFGFTETSPWSDFVLIVEDTRLHVAKNILSLASPVFDRMLQSEFKESSSDELELPGKNMIEVVEFLRCIYPNSPANITSETAQKILPLTDEYQVFHLKDRCERALLEILSSETPVLELLEHLRQACLFNLEHLREKCVALASVKSKDELDEAKQECHPPAEAFNEILERMNEKLRIEVSEVNTSFKHLSKELETLKLDTTVVHEELEVMKQYLTADLKVYKDLGLDGDLNWKSDQTVFIVNVNSKGVAAMKELSLWDIPLKITVSVSDYLQLKIEKNRENETIDSKFVITSVLVCRQPRGKNEMLKFEEKFYWIRQTISKSLTKINEINQAHHGFMRDGKIGLILHIYMSEPNKK